MLPLILASLVGFTAQTKMSVEQTLLDNPRAFVEICQQVDAAATPAQIKQYNAMSKAGKETEDTTALAVASTCRGVFESIIDTIGAADSYSVAGQKVCVPAGGISPAEVFSAMAAAPSKISTPPTSGVSAPTYIRGVIQALYVCK